MTKPLWWIVWSCYAALVICLILLRGEQIWLAISTFGITSLLLFIWRAAK